MPTILPMRTKPRIDHSALYVFGMLIAALFLMVALEVRTDASRGKPATDTVLEDASTHMYTEFDVYAWPVPSERLVYTGHD